MDTRSALKHTFFALALTALFSSTPSFAQSTEASSINTRLASLAKSLVNARKEMRKGFAELRATSSTSNATAPAIGNNTPSTSYEAIDFYDGRKASPVLQHNSDGLTLALRVYEAGAKVEEKIIKFNFDSRSADQKEADTLVLKTCLDMFLRAEERQGSFFIMTNPDPKLGILCSVS